MSRNHMYSKFEILDYDTLESKFVGSAEECAEYLRISKHEFLKQASYFRRQLTSGARLGYVIDDLEFITCVKRESKCKPNIYNSIEHEVIKNNKLIFTGTLEEIANEFGYTREYLRMLAKHGIKARGKLLIKPKEVVKNG